MKLFLSPLSAAVFLAGMSLNSIALADNGHSSSQPSRAISHAPIAVMGDHLHKQGEFMVSYRYMDMKMEGLLQGDKDIALDDVLNNYMMAPKAMDMRMHMLGLMYAPSDDITLMVMLNYLDNDMDSVMRMSMPHSDMNMDHMDDTTMSHSNMSDLNMSDLNMSDLNMSHSGMDSDFSTSSSGLGDTRISALINGVNGDNYRSHFSLGLSLPTGEISINEIKRQ